MRWPSDVELTEMCPLPAGYRLATLRFDQIGTLIEALHEWHPAFAVGGASKFSRLDFYSTQASFRREPERDLLVLVIMHGKELAGMFAEERDRDALSLYARLGVVAPQHRGSGLIQALAVLLEETARAMGCEYVYLTSTLRHKAGQIVCEQHGFQLVGIAPGLDCEVVETGRVKRVYEAVYAKLLVDQEELSPPDHRCMTPKVSALFAHLFPDTTSESALS